MGVKEQKPGNNRKPFIFYYAMVMLIMTAINLFLMPSVQRKSVTEVPYNTFRDMIEEGVVTQVGRNEQQITFLAKTGEKNPLGDDAIRWYKTGNWPDEDLTQVLRDNGIAFSEEIIEPTSPIVSSWYHGSFPLCCLWSSVSFCPGSFRKDGRQCHDIR